MDNSIIIELQYNSRGKIGTASTNERIYHRIPALAADAEQFKKDIKKALRLFNNESIYRYEIVVYTSIDYHENRLFLICQESGDYTNGTLHFYDYTTETAQVPIRTTTDKVIYKSILHEIDNIISNQEEKTA